MKAAELKDVEAIARRVAIEVARCPGIVPEKVKPHRCTMPRGHASYCSWSAVDERAWTAAEVT